jgi:hypothetical protein
VKIPPLGAALLAAALLSAASAAEQSDVFESAHAPNDVELTADPATPFWKDAPRVLASRDRLGEPVAGPPTEVRSRWTRDHLYLLYICPFAELTLRPEMTAGAETDGLWRWDVGEAFIGSDPARIGWYKEFQVSPRGEWTDLAIDRDNPKGQEGARWNSGMIVKGRVDAAAKVWYGEMRIPFTALDVAAPRVGAELRINLFRIAGAEPSRTRYVWRPTGQNTFHVPSAFGTLRLR